MPLSNTVIRRYTPPTCTLEVFAQSSPLSRWMGRTVLKQLTFELRFDDPRLPEEHRVPIRGDRNQLEALCDAVTSYVQQFLQQPPESFWVSFSGTQESSTALNEPELELSTKTLNSFNTPFTGSNIHLEPSSYLTHNLFLGSLANQTSGPVIQLSLLQLFDLATALDEYSTNVMALPTLNTRSSDMSFPAWAPIAAVLVLAVGFLPVTWQYANNIRQKQQTAKTSDPTQVKTALQPSSPLTFPTPQPGITTPADNLLGSTPPPSVSSLPQTPLTTNNSSLPTTPSVLPNNALGIPPLAQSQTPISPNNSAIAPSSKIPGQEIAILPNLGQNLTTSKNPQAEALPKRRNLPPSLSSNTPNFSPNVSPIVPPSVATIPNNNRSNVPSQTSPLSPSQQLDETISALQAAAPVNKLPTEQPSSVTPTSNPFIDRLGDGSKPPTSRQVATGTLFDTPQVAEAREYLTKRWQPPAGLGQTLEYSLIVSVDGTVERIFPLNKAAREYVDSAGMPQVGQPFVSANTRGQNVRIRVVLSPDGKVQTFPDE
ncbi:hypothetical protein VF14_06805 [Nostoc linckia z18]|uniref:DUF4335 domain-containing protein n=2 Tax=Nostoc linckia TaxID=92942 RepID=A0A9Q5ZFN6_NOSLI|nr:DUF4335 domain-containing protein [Nostoc linckia]PHK32507.1 hypothetical protein VF12_26520 [Nostoc linckia z15]PHK44985.1 hypothetical protein VF13_18670 [Nostoc linckia z16]PHJ61615.1 hypothetical protein VF05_28325 [Nostoc linckia z3]PHJ61709.1 hypothetical protein VF02_19210 [Nostoc linckia z1]PHJ76792.1 hypothetical protein VF03_06750 [Nostoc linckia z2]